MSQLSWFTLGLIFGVSVTLIGLTVGLILRDRKKREHYFSPIPRVFHHGEDHDKWCREPGCPAAERRKILPPPSYED